MRDDEIARWRAAVRDRVRLDGRRLSADVVEELACHLTDRYLAALRQGGSEREARQRALGELNAASFDPLASRRRARLRVPVTDAMPSLLRDIRHALRQLRRSPAFTATAVLTLAIGIGANTAVFTLVHAVLLKSLPVAHAGELYRFGDEYRCCPDEIVQGNWSTFSYPFYLEVRDNTPAFDELAAMDTLRPNFGVRRATGTGAAESFTGEFVSGNYFTTLGVAALAGRVFSAADDRKGAGPVAVASYAAWQKYGFDASLVGEPITISGIAVTLVGVAPSGFFGDRLDSHPPDFWLPLSLEPTFTREGSLLETPNAGWLYLMGRLRPGAQPAQVQTQLTAALRNYLRVPGHVTHADELGKIDAQVIRLAPGAGGMNAMRREYEQGLYLLLAVSAAVLLMACANLANLLLVRAAGQRVRTAVELAIGASRSRVVYRCLTESLVLALLGGAAGLALAPYATRAILLVTFRGAPHVPIDTHPSGAVLAFTFAVSLATGVLFGAVPAWLASRSDPGDVLRLSSRVVGGAALPQRSLVILQGALSLVLVTVAGLLTESLRNVDRQPLGFEPSGRVIVEIDPQGAGYTQPRLEALYRKIDERLSRMPGVVSESLSLYTAQQGDSIWGGRVFFEGGRGPFSALWDRVGPRYFETIGTGIVQGRGIDSHDVEDSRRVAVVNEAFVRRFFPNENPIGRHFGKFEPAHANDFEIVGVVRDARYLEPSADVRPMFFVPLAQTIRFSGDISNKMEESSRYVGAIELHVHGDPDAFGSAIRGALADVDPNLAPIGIASLPDLLGNTTSERTLIARLSDAFGAIALLLAGVGLYGVTAYRVAQRKGEIALRMALGATSGNITALVVRGACSQTAVGLLVGVPLAVLAARALRTQLFGVSPFNASMVAAAAVVIAGCALVASALPARRAGAIAPMDVLRSD